MIRILFLVVILLHPLAVGATEKIPTDRAQLSQSEMLTLGETMYRRGILPSGGTMKAILQGNIEADGLIFTCTGCHLRSGMGAVESSVLSLPINGKALFSPLIAGHFNMGLPSLFRGMQPGIKMSIPWFKPVVSARPAYTEHTLAYALRKGIDPAGRKFSSTMPTYPLTDDEAKILILYLRNLLAIPSPGVTDVSLNFATIVTEGVNREDREAMLIPLRAFMQIKNSRADVMRGRRRVAELMDGSSRQLVLDVWELKGAPETWSAQLEDYYRKKPVFALLGGIAAGEWTPIHQFCEQQGIPCILPVTDFPVLSDKDWYTLYFSQGFYQEAEAVAGYLDELPGFATDTPIVQVFRVNREGDAFSSGFQKTWSKAGGSALKNITIKEMQVIDESFWQRLTADYPGAVLILWLPAKDLDGIEYLAQGKTKPRSVFLSSTLLKEKLTALPGSIRDFTYLTYPYRLPEEAKGLQQPPQMGQMNAPISVEAWLKARNLQSANMNLTSRTFFLTQLLSQVLLYMEGNFYRDYFLDLFDMLEDQTTSADYPRLSFGPGQRYAAAGCYIVQLSGDKNPVLIKKNEWSTH
jgi:hypothetical protein